MPTHAERKTLPYTPQQLFDLVLDIESYPEFLPWCLGARENWRDDKAGQIHADLMIGYGPVKEKFVSLVSYNYADQARDVPFKINVEYQDGPMRYLSNHWQFIPQDKGHCMIDFYVDFEFKNAILQKMMELFFHEAVRRMVHSFEQRANALYGSNAIADN